MQEAFFRIQERFNYVGWVPCVSGKLFFEYCSCGLGRQYQDVNHLQFNSDKTGIPTRYIIINSIVDWQDSVVSGANGVCSVTLIAETKENNDTLEGEIHICFKESPVRNQKPSPTQLKNKNFLESLHALIRTVRYDSWNEKNIEAGFLKVYNLLRYEDKGTEAHFVVRFCLQEVGISYLGLESSGKSVDNDEQLAIIRQAFYYLKYSMHKHQHHDRDDDSLTTIHKIPRHKKDIGLILINDLKHGLVQLKRNFGTESNSSRFGAKGIASYGISLIKACESSQFISPEAANQQLVIFGAITASIESRVEEYQAQEDRRVTAINKSRGLIFLILALLSPWIIMLSKGAAGEPFYNPESKVAEILKYIVSSDWHILYSFLFLMIIYHGDKLLYSNFPSGFLGSKGFRVHIASIIKEENKWVSSFIVIALLLIAFSLIIEAVYSLFVGETLWPKVF